MFIEKVTELSKKEDIPALLLLQQSTHAKDQQLVRLAILLCLQQTHDFDQLQNRLRQWRLKEFALDFCNRMLKRLNREGRVAIEGDHIAQAQRLIQEWLKKQLNLKQQKLLKDLQTKKPLLEEPKSSEPRLPILQSKPQRKNLFRKVPVLPSSLLQNKIMKQLVQSRQRRGPIKQERRQSPEALRQLCEQELRISCLQDEFRVQSQERKLVVQRKQEQDIFGFLQDFENKELKFQQSVAKKRTSSKRPWAQRETRETSREKESETRLNPGLDLRRFMFKR